MGEGDNPSPFLYSDHIYNWLESALDYGITEREFWEMTIAELDRAKASKDRVREFEAKQKATYDYILAETIGRSIARLYSSKATMPAIDKVYPSLFESEEVQKQQHQLKQELSIQRFKQFALTYNSKYKEVAKNTDE